jgi:hypothetical protein
VHRHTKVAFVAALVVACWGAKASSQKDPVRATAPAHVAASPAAASSTTKPSSGAPTRSATTEGTMSGAPAQALLDKMVEYARSDLRAQLKKQKGVAERLKRPAPARFVGSEEEVVAILASKSAAPYVPIIRRHGADLSLWMWLPGLAEFDVFAYRFDANGTALDVRVRIKSWVLLGP